jgi:hypothetical protein
MKLLFPETCYLMCYYLLFAWVLFTFERGSKPQLEVAAVDGQELLAAAGVQAALNTELWE